LTGSAPAVLLQSGASIRRWPPARGQRQKLGFCFILIFKS